MDEAWLDVDPDLVELVDASARLVNRWTEQSYGTRVCRHCGGQGESCICGILALADALAKYLGSDEPYA